MTTPTAAAGYVTDSNGVVHNTNIFLPQTQNNKSISINQYDSTNIKLAYTAGANGSDVRSIFVSNSDASNAANLKLFFQPVENAAITISRTTTTATVTDTAHGFSTGMYITISGCASPNLNGTFSITEASINTYTYTCTDTGGATDAGTRNANYLFTTVNIPIKTGSDTAGLVPMINFMQAVAMASTDLDNAGNRVFKLSANTKFYVGVVVAVAAAKNLNISVRGVDY